MSNPTGTFTLFKRETMRFMKVYMQTLISPVVSNLLYFAVFGISLHRTITDIQGVTYIEFLVPGLIIMGLINNAYQNPSSSIIIMKYQELIGGLMTIPLSRLEILAAFISSAVLRAFLVGLMTFLTALLFVQFHYTSVLIIFTTALLVSLFFSFLGMIIGICADEFDRQAFIQNFILMPLIFLGGVFYPITNLPQTFQTISLINPIFHMINLLRYGFTGVLEFSLSGSFSILTIGVFFLGILNYSVLRSGYRLQN